MRECLPYLEYQRQVFIGATEPPFREGVRGRQAAYSRACKSTGEEVLAAGKLRVGYA
jgi:hypothetical protein